MTPRRKELDKLYNRIYKIAQKGHDYIYDYYNLVDDVISNGQYYILEDVMISKYGISMRNFLSINDFKKFSFEEIRKFTNLSSSELIQKLLNQKSVYFVGYHLFDKVTNHYLGDLREEETTDTRYIHNRKLIEMSIDIVAESGIKSSAFECIPKFENNPILKINYNNGQQLIYLESIYECIKSYTYSTSNRITPTYSLYWTPVYLPTYSRLEVTDDNISLVQKYSDAIDFLKGLTYSYDPSENTYVVVGYTDNYFE